MIYAFRIQNSGVYQVTRWDWETEEFNILIDWTESIIINDQGFNDLRVLAEGARISFFINNEFVGEVVNQPIEAGIFGLTTAQTPEQFAKFELDSFFLSLSN